MQERLWIKDYDAGIAHEVGVLEIPLHRFLEETAGKYPTQIAAGVAGAEFIRVMSTFYRSIKQVQPNTSPKKVIVSRIKDYFPPVVRTVFTLFMEKKMGHRVELEAGDEGFQDVLARRSPEQRPTP